MGEQINCVLQILRDLILDALDFGFMRGTECDDLSWRVLGEIITWARGERGSHYRSEQQLGYPNTNTN